MIDFPALWIAVQGKLFALLVLTLLDFVLGVAVALVRKRFSWDKLRHYLDSDILPILAWLAVEVIAALPQDVIPASAVSAVVNFGVYGTVFLAILTSILGSMAEVGVLQKGLSKVGVRPEVEVPLE